MPLYDIRCSRTGKIFERMIPLANFEELIRCACGSPATRVISTPMFTVDQTGYNCPITEKWIGSKSQHEENLKEHGCRVLEAGETNAATARRRADDDALDRQVDNTVEREIEAMPSAKREKLYNELVHSDLEVIRK